jgi:hypothetical protein
MLGVCDRMKLYRGCWHENMSDSNTHSFIPDVRASYGLSTRSDYSSITYDTAIFSQASPNRSTESPRACLDHERSHHDLAELFAIHNTSPRGRRSQLAPSMEPSARAVPSRDRKATSTKRHRHESPKALSYQVLEQMHPDSHVKAAGHAFTHIPRLGWHNMFWGMSTPSGLIRFALY